MRVMTVLGTRPEIIRLSRLIEVLDKSCDHTLVHTGQNYDPLLSDLFFDELGVRRPDEYLGVKSHEFGEQLGQLFGKIEKLFKQYRPERLLVLGDTNSGLVAIIAKRLGIQVFHMEAGNRCYDDRVPEEVNRRIIDHSSTVLIPYTHRSKENLLAEGIARERIFVSGNPINEVLTHYAPSIDSSSIVDHLGLQESDYFLVTAHRSENVDQESRLRTLIDALANLQQVFGKRVVCSVHPRTRSRIDAVSDPLQTKELDLIEPLGLFDFVRLEKSAFCIITDSGTVQEEACIFGKPNVTIREVTERPETIEAGSNILSGIEPDAVESAARLVTDQIGSWNPPAEYLAEGVSQIVSRIVLGYRLLDRAEQTWLDDSAPQV
ncbi:MAG: UDP-N-acetylglucosamine 2-epimerase (non-hydrolyzing) [Chloroflexi bacterium]|nr:UDP-N-acetylglucosamine 2-epimerase (non-hydrolyzing) [Chloroflexota bacterium]